MVLLDDNQWEDPVTFTVLNAPPTPLEIWRGQHFSAADLGDPTKEASVWGNNADPDRDGNPNGKEYAFGGDPLDPSDSHLHFGVRVTSGAGGEPVLELTSWQRSNDPTLTFTHEGTADLQIWNSRAAYTVVVSAIPVDAEIHQVTFRDTGLGVTGGSIGFWLDARVKVDWPVRVGKAGRYAVHARVASTDASKFALEVGDQKLAAGTPSTGCFDKFQNVVLGEITLAEGKNTDGRAGFRRL